VGAEEKVQPGNGVREDPPRPIRKVGVGLRQAFEHTQAAPVAARVVEEEVLAVDPAQHERPFDEPDPVSGCHPEPVLEVLAVAEALVEIPDARDAALPEDDTGHGDRVHCQQVEEEVPDIRRVGPESGVDVRIEDLGSRRVRSATEVGQLAEHEVDVRVVRQEGGLGLQLVRHPEVVRVEKRDPVSRRLAHRAVARGGLPCVLLDEVADGALHPPDQVGRPVRRAVVDDEDLVDADRLLENTRDGIPEVGRTVVGRDDHGHPE